MKIAPDLPLTLLGSLTPQEFLRDFWQKKPLLIRQAIPNYISPISADELAGLSLEEEVESRIILEDGESPWELRRGPFQEEIYGQLPESKWTLLVQAVDQFVPEFQSLLEQFHFLPSWRIDDLMISYATDGGGVGPHYDNYDVFLLQAEGKRRWKLGQMCDDQSALMDHPDLKILADFQQTAEFILEPGDMLYLPPRLAHYGIAEGECMTFSVGFRAPGANEILAGFTDFIGQFIPDEDRYSDADCVPTTTPHQIDAHTIKRLRKVIESHLNDDNLLTAWFGQFMTEPRYPELVSGIEDLTLEDCFSAMADGYTLEKNPSGRLAWFDGGDHIQLFASGSSRCFSPQLKELIALLCESTSLNINTLEPWLDDEEALTLIYELIKQGSLELIEYE